MEEEKVTMTEQEAADALRKYISDTGKTQTAVAKELNISSGALSSFLKGAYKAPHTIVPKVQELLDIQERRKEAPGTPGYARTSVSQTVYNAISYSHLEKIPSVVYGDAGIGKTMAFEQYLKENSLALGITICPTYSSIAGVNELLAKQLGVRERISRRITSEIISKITDSGRVIAVDEAQFLPGRTINHLRCLSDQAKIGICFIGNYEIYTRIYGNRDEEYSQLYSRMGMSKVVMTTDITRTDIQEVFGRFEVDDRSLDVLHRISRTKYGMRGAVNAFRLTANTFGRITAENITRVMRDTSIGMNA